MVTPHLVINSPEALPKNPSELVIRVPGENARTPEQNTSGPGHIGIAMVGLGSFESRHPAGHKATDIDSVNPLGTEEEHRPSWGYPDFYLHTDNDAITQSSEQLQASAILFNSLFDDVMLDNMGHTTQLEIIEGEPEAKLVKKIVVDGQEYTLCLNDKTPIESNIIGDKTFRDSQLTKRDIRLTRVEDGETRESWSYRLGKDEIVRRIDLGDLWTKRQAERGTVIEDLGIEPANTAAQGLRNVAELLKRTAEGKQNSELEEDMGLNNQPSSTLELAGLQGFLERAK